MANYGNLNTLIDNNVYQNSTGAVTGAVLNNVLKQIVASLGNGYQYKGLATPSTVPGTPDQRVFYLGGAGTYENFDSSVNVDGGDIIVFYFDTAWHHSIVAIAADDIAAIKAEIGDTKVTMTPKSTTPGSVPCSDGSLAPGGNDYAARDYAIEGLNEFLTINSQFPTPAPSSFTTAVLFAIYSESSYPGTSNFLAAGPLFSSGEKTGKIDLSLYPTAKLLRISIKKTDPNYEVFYKKTKFALQSDMEDVQAAVAALVTGAVLKTDIVDNLESSATNKPLSAKQGKVLNDKFYIDEQITAYTTTPGSIPQNDGSLKDGGATFGAKDFDVDGLSGNVVIVSDAPTPQAGQYVNSVTFGIYDIYPLQDPVQHILAVGNLLSNAQRETTVDLSQYQGAKCIRVTTNKTNRAATVTKVGEKYATKESVDAIDARVETLEDEVEGLNTMEHGIEVHLPAEFVVPQGGRLEIFHRGVVKAIDPYMFHIEVISPVGKAYPRYFLFQPTASNVGNSYALTYNVRRTDGTLIATGSSTIRVIAAATSPSSTKNVLCVGASIMAQGYVASELRRRLTAKSGDADYGNGTPLNPYGAALQNIVFVGRKTGTQVTTIQQEATGGWSWAEYAGQGRAAYRFTVTGVNQLNIGDVYTVGALSLTIAEINVTDGSGNIRCTYSGTGTPPASGTLALASGEGDATITYTDVESEAYNPFYNNGGLDFENYADLYCDGAIDYLVIFLGNNDLGGNIETIMGNVQTFIEAFHSDFPTGKAVICNLALPDPTGGMGANYGASATMNYFQYAAKVWEFDAALKAFAAARSTYVVMAPTIQEFDCEYSYPYGDVPVNNRSSDTVRLGQNGIHPTADGQKMFSDTLFFIFNDIL